MYNVSYSPSILTLTKGFLHAMRYGYGLGMLLTLAGVICYQHSEALWDFLMAHFQPEIAPLIFSNLFSVFGAVLGGLIGMTCGLVMHYFTLQRKLGLEAQHIEIQLDEQALKIQGNGFKQRYNWQYVETVSRSRNTFHIRCAHFFSQTQLSIPTDAFTDEKEAAAFYAFLNKQHKARSSWQH